MNKTIKLFELLDSNTKFINGFLNHANSYFNKYDIAMRFRLYYDGPTPVLYVEVPEVAEDEVNRKFALNYIFMTMGATANRLW